MKVTRRDLPRDHRQDRRHLESYWNSTEFEYYSEEQKERLARALKAEKYFDANNAQVYTMDIAPYSYQQEILDKLEAERTVRGYHPQFGGGSHRHGQDGDLRIGLQALLQAGILESPAGCSLWRTGRRFCGRACTPSALF